MFKWLFQNNGKDTSVIDELATRSSIACKLSKYNSDEDTTISEFSIADESDKARATKKSSLVKKNDPWSQANPRETGKWNRENR